MSKFFCDGFSMPSLKLLHKELDEALLFWKHAMKMTGRIEQIHDYGRSLWGNEWRWISNFWFIYRNKHPSYLSSSLARLQFICSMQYILMYCYWEQSIASTGLFIVICAAWHVGVVSSLLGNTHCNWMLIQIYQCHANVNCKTTWFLGSFWI